MKYKVRTAGRYLVRGDERLVVQEFTNYEASLINGMISPAHRVFVFNSENKSDNWTFFPGQVIDVPAPKVKKKRKPRTKKDT